MICPIAATAKIIGHKWTLLIIRDLMVEERRFSELQRSLEGISPRTLSERLSWLEEQGFVNRKQYPEIPPRVEYSLTTKGRALKPVLEAIESFGREWMLPQKGSHA